MTEFDDGDDEKDNKTSSSSSFLSLQVLDKQIVNLKQSLA